MQIDQRAAAFAGDGLHRAFDGGVTIAGCRSEDVAHYAMGVHADQHRFAAFNVAPHQCDVRFAAVDFALIGDQAKLSVMGADQRFAHAVHVALVLHAVADQFGHRQHFHVVEFCRTRPGRGCAPWCRHRA